MLVFQANHTCNMQIDVVFKKEVGGYHLLSLNNDADFKIINWEDFFNPGNQSVLFKLSNKKFTLIFSQINHWSVNTAFTTLLTIRELKYMIYNYFPNARSTCLGDNFIHLAQLIRDNCPKDNSSTNEINREIDSTYHHIKNRMSHCPAIELADDIITKIFERYLSVKHLHAYECTNRQALNQISRIWPRVFIFQPRNKIIEMGQSINYLVKSSNFFDDYFKNKLIRFSSGGYFRRKVVDKTKILFDLFSNSKQLNKLFVNSLNYKNNSFSEHFLKLGADISRCGVRELVLSIRNGHDEVFDKIINHKKIFLSLTDHVGTSPLVEAVLEGDLEKVEKLVKRGYLTPTLKDVSLSSSLIRYASDHISIMEFLLKEAAKSNHLCNLDLGNLLSTMINQKKWPFIEVILKSEMEPFFKKNLLAFAIKEILNHMFKEIETPIDHSQNEMLYDKFLYQLLNEEAFQNFDCLSSKEFLDLAILTLEKFLEKKSFNLNILNVVVRLYDHFSENPHPIMYLIGIIEIFFKKLPNGEDKRISLIAIRNLYKKYQDFLAIHGHHRFAIE